MSNEKKDQSINSDDTDYMALYELGVIDELPEEVPATKNDLEGMEE